jgi:sialic acid synthase SpsE
VSSYPTEIHDVNLGAIRTLKHLVHGPREVGYSDHTNGVSVPADAVLVGATTIEKHFTLDRNGPGVDNPVSADPEMMKRMIDYIRSNEKILGDGEIKMSDVEKDALVFRRIS